MKYQANTAFLYFKRYLSKFFHKEWSGWLKTAWFYGPISLLLLGGIIAIAVYCNPIPPKNVSISTGQAGSSYETISKQFQEEFKKQGITLNLVPSSGLLAGLKDLNSQSSDVSASFMTAGITSAEQYPNLVSLGSIQYVPIWLFYRGDTIKTADPFEYFANKKISIGSPGNITNQIFRNLYELNQKHDPSASNFVELSLKESGDQLLSGKLDAIFVVDSYRSETVQRMINSKEIKIMNFPLADAYLKMRPYLQKVVIPRGSIRLDSIYPEEDLTILTSTTTLLVEKNVHPAIQWTYLLAAQNIGANSKSFFSNPGYFPKNLDQSFPLSPEAKKFYEKGMPTVFDYLPVGLASLFEEVWAYVLIFLLFIYPGYQLFNTIRTFPSEDLMNKMFINLRELDEATIAATTKEELEQILVALKVYESEIQTNWLFEKNSRFYFNQKNAVAAVRRDAQTKLEALAT